MNHLIESRSGVYWIATNGGGVCRFAPTADASSVDAGRGKRFLVYPVGDTPQSNRINILCEDRDGRIWAGGDGGLFRLDLPGGEQTFRRIDLNLSGSPEASAVSALVEDRRGMLWAGVADAGLCRIAPDGEVRFYTTAHGLPSNVVRRLLVDRQGQLWATTRNGLCLIMPESEMNGAIVSRLYTTADGLANNIMTSVLEASDGRLYVSSLGGLSVIDGGRVQSYTTAQGLAESNIGGLAEDIEGNIWMGTGGSGAMKLIRSGFVAYDEIDSSGLNRIHNMFEAPDGRLHIVGADGAVSRFDGKGFVVVRPALPPDSSLFWMSHMVFVDQAGEWWLLLGSHLIRYAPQRNFEQALRARPKAVYASEVVPPGNIVYRIFEDSRGDLWIGTSGRSRSRLVRWRRAGETFEHFGESDGLPAFNSPFSFCEDGAGNLWIGFYEGGIARYAAGRFTFYTAADGWPAGMITSLYRDRAGRLWVASNTAGLSRIDDPLADRPALITYSTADGLSSNDARCITEDPQGRIYIGTARGIDRLDPATGRMKHYTMADGLRSDYVTTALCDQRGWLWFGTMKGVARLIPEFDSQVAPPPVMITGLTIAGIMQRVSELGQTEVAGLVLEPGQGQIQIEFAGLSFGLGEALRFQYQLEGASEQWSAPTDQRSVNLSLSAGAYRFLVRAIKSDGTTSELPASVSFRLLPPVWRRWWFMAMAGLAIASLAYLLYRYRLRRVIELERVRTRIATDLHDDIGASLSRMAILSEVVKRQTQTDHQESAGMLAEIAESARSLVDSMSDIVWSIDPRKDDLANLATRVRMFASDILEAQGIRWQFDAPSDLAKVKLPPDARRHLFLILKEAVNNIARHSGCAEARIRLAVDHRRLSAEIADDGRGIAPAEDRPQARRGGNGLRNMSARAGELGGELRIDSSPQGGTTLKLTVPLR